MRQDPDIIMVGEIRDLETADMAIQAALTGHLVLSTLHTNDAPSAITRLLDLGVPPYLINCHPARRHGAAPGAHAVPALQEQGAVRRSRADDLLGGIWSRRGKPSARRTFISSVGCLECRMTGYLGRIGIYEILLMSPAMKRLVTPRPTSPACANWPTRKA